MGYFIVPPSSKAKFIDGRWIEPHDGQCVCDGNRKFEQEFGYTAEQQIEMNPGLIPVYREVCPHCPLRKMGKQCSSDNQEIAPAAESSALPAIAGVTAVVAVALLPFTVMFAIAFVITSPFFLAARWVKRQIDEMGESKPVTVDANVASATTKLPAPNVIRLSAPKATWAAPKMIGTTIDNETIEIVVIARPVEYARR